MTTSRDTERKAGITRRELIGTAAAVGAATALAPRPGAAADLPARGEFVIRNAAYVLTMDPTLGEIAQGDVHVRNGEIVAVGRNVAAPGAEVIDGRTMIALPGLVETHSHTWNSTCRSLVMEGPQRGYFRTVRALGEQYTPEDMYRGVRLGCAEMIYGGVTTVHSWSHNLRTSEHARADIRALMDTGIRGRFSYGTYQGGPPQNQTMDIADLERLHGEWAKYSNEGLLTLGMASRGVNPSGISANHPVLLEVAHKDWAAARALKLPITVHTGGKGNVELLEREGCSAPTSSSSTPAPGTPPTWSASPSPAPTSASRRRPRCAIRTRCRRSSSSSSSTSRSACRWTRHRSPATTTCSWRCAR